MPVTRCLRSPQARWLSLQGQREQGCGRGLCSQFLCRLGGGHPRSERQRSLTAWSKLPIVAKQRLATHLPRALISRWNAGALSRAAGALSHPSPPWGHPIFLRLATCPKGAKGGQGSWDRFLSGGGASLRAEGDPAHLFDHLIGYRQQGLGGLQVDVETRI